MPEVGRLVANRRKTAPESWGAPAPLPASWPSPAHTRGFIEVQNGCDHRCTFCIIPFGRGASRSVDPDAVIARAHALMAEGVREIVLTGVDLTDYRHDRLSTAGLGGLVAAVLAALPALPRLRLSSLDCVEADPALVAH